MLKGIIILTLAFYVFYKVSSFFFRAGAASQQSRQPIDHDRAAQKKSKSTNVKGGEYVDYEEVK